MAKFESYLPGGDNDPNAPAGGIDAEITDAAKDQQAREANATPGDWEERYKNLEVLNSQQAQTVGEYRRVIDSYLLNDVPTPASEPVVETLHTPITYEDLNDNPEEAINKAVANHPAIKRAAEIEATLEAQQRTTAVATFRESHPDFETIKDTPEFASWVRESPTRIALVKAADSWDMNSADALFSLYKAEKGITKLQNEQQEATAIQQATLEDSTAALTLDEPKFSRQEFVDKKILANQGDREAERWINANVASYRLALQSGNVRD
ncbi:MAG: hypothetical protein V3T23_08190 [Nitrososphaerales archaeon]